MSRRYLYSYEITFLYLYFTALLRYSKYTSHAHQPNRNFYEDWQTGWPLLYRSCSVRSHLFGSTSTNALSGVVSIDNLYASQHCQIHIGTRSTYCLSGSNPSSEYASERPSRDPGRSVSIIILFSCIL